MLTLHETDLGWIPGTLYDLVTLSGMIPEPCQMCPCRKKKIVPSEVVLVILYIWKVREMQSVNNKQGMSGKVWKGTVA